METELFGFFIFLLKLAAIVLGSMLGGWGVGAIVERRRVKVAMRDMKAVQEGLDLRVSILTDERARERKRADSYRDMIEVAQAERNQWRQLYLEHSSQHGAAQDLLLRERDVNAQRLVKAGIRPFIDARIEAVTRDFREEHVLRGAALAQGLDVSTDPEPPPPPVIAHHLSGGGE